MAAEIDYDTNTINIPSMGIFEIDGYINLNHEEVDKRHARFVRIKSSVFTYYIDVK